MKPKPKPLTKAYSARLYGDLGLKATRKRPRSVLLSDRASTRRQRHGQNRASGRRVRIEQVIAPAEDLLKEHRKEDDKGVLIPHWWDDVPKYRRKEHREQPEEGAVGSIGEHPAADGTPRPMAAHLITNRMTRWACGDTCVKNSAIGGPYAVKRHPKKVSSPIVTLTRAGSTRCCDGGPRAACGCAGQWDDELSVWAARTDAALIPS